MSKAKFNTCFFERYAKLTLETVLGPRYSALVNRDRPDLQMEDRSLGIEVTRAMEENKSSALSLLKEMAGLNQDIIDSGYTYGFGLQEGMAVGSLEYDYWSLAQPLKRIVASKIEKVGSGFYGNFEDYGLYVFCKYDLTHDEVIMTALYALELQRHIDIRYTHLYLAQAEKFYICALAGSPEITPSLHSEIIWSDEEIVIHEFGIGPELRRKFFLGALRKDYPQPTDPITL